MAEINPKIFKAYDIRGIYPTDINEDAAYKIGRAVVQALDAKKIAVGRDIRESSPALHKALIKGITDQGADVIDLGLTSSPMVYFASGNLDVDVAISMTASHNPPEWNGMKFCKRDGYPVGETTGLNEMKKLALEGKFADSVERGKIIKEEEFKQKYYDYFLAFAALGDKKYKVVIDTANAMGILELEMYKKLSNNIELVTLYDEFDGRFPNHEANPLKTETLDALKEKVVETNADLGISYDGDADRIGFVTEKGDIIPMDLVTAILAKEILKRHPGGKIYFDLRSSKAVGEVIQENGGIPLECPVGYTKIKKLIRDNGAVFAGELSGHYYFQENYYSEIGTLVAIMLLNLMTETGEKISDLVKDVKRYFHSGEINSKVADVKEKINEIKEKYADAKQNDMDGISVEYPDWWFNVRGSNTEPVLRLNLEAKTQEMMEEKRDEVLGIIRG